MEPKQRTISVDKDLKVLKLKVKAGTMIYDGSILLIYEEVNNEGEGNLPKKLKSSEIGVVKRVSIKEGDIAKSGSVIVELEKECSHPTVIKDLCAECGADLQKEDNKDGPHTQASVSMVHMVPELKVNDELAKILGKADMDRLLEHRKLVLLVDLDQTLIHTTNDNIPNNIKDVYHFQLYGSRSPWYHTRLRPGTHNFLQGISEKYELHICTFGSRRYAHMIAAFLDPDGKFFSHRILSRDECFDPNSKTANLKALFPCGESMVCIIDDREDVWEYASNLIHVKPYRFFQHTGDIHAPPGLTKCENDSNKDGFDFSHINNGMKDGNREIDNNLSKNNDRNAEEEESSNSGENSESSPSDDTKEGILNNESTENKDAVADIKVKTELLTVAEIKTEPDAVSESKENDTQKLNSSNMDVENPELKTEIKMEPISDEVKIENVVKEDAMDVDDNSANSATGVPEPAATIISPTNTNVALTSAVSTSTPTTNDPPATTDSDLTSAVSTSTPTTNDPPATRDSEGSTTKSKTPLAESSVLVAEASLPVANTSVAVAGSSAPVAEPSASVAKPLAPVAEVSVSVAKPSAPIAECPAPPAECSTLPAECPAPPAECSAPAAVEEPVAGVERPRISSSSLDANGLIVIEETDDYLLYLEEILKIIHAEFFGIYERTGRIPDLKQVIPETRAKVLNGVNLVFSGIVPNRMRLEKSPAYRIAVALGANVTQNIEPDSTHLVALRAGTAKVHVASKRKHLKVVTPEWLWTCAERWEKVDERLFPLKSSKLNTEARNPPAHCRSPEHPEPLPFTYPSAGAVSSATAPVTQFSPPQVGGFMYTINPLMSLSSEDIEKMAGEVEDIFMESDGELDDPFVENDGDETETAAGNRKRKLSSRSSSSDDGLKIDEPKKRKKKKLKSLSNERRRSFTDYGIDVADDEDEDEDEDDDGDDDRSEPSDSDDETLNTKFRRGEALPSDLDLDYNTEEGTEEERESDGEWNVMGAALEREFLEGE